MKISIWRECEGATVWAVRIKIEKQAIIKNNRGTHKATTEAIIILGGKKKIICGIMRTPAKHAENTKINEGRDIFFYRADIQPDCDGFLEGLVPVSWALTQPPDDRPGIEP